MTQLIEEEFTFPVTYGNTTLQLRGFVFRPAEADKSLPPFIFNSGFTGGVAMYGQLFGRTMAARGYNAVTYDVSGFFSNRDVRNTSKAGDVTVTNVSLEDQTIELLALIEWTRQRFGAAPAVASWAMGAVASLAAVSELARSDREQIAYYVPMSYTRLSALQNLRADAVGAHLAISALADDAAIPPFDTGTAATQTGFYPLDPATQDYTDVQLGKYTEVGKVDRWPGCSHVTALSYKSYVTFDPESDLAGIASDFPPALIIHGIANSLHMPSESVRLHQVYPGLKGDAPVLIDDMKHGQQLEDGNPIFETLIGKIDEAIRAAHG
ncbi:hypothetical protein [Microbaculum sp. FT89]|uniref:hypothetical protein n=1 Tax=Microbaculum sp. FT89 TaxID=3447298 RepID=UPI003F539833